MPPLSLDDKQFALCPADDPDATPTVLNGTTLLLALMDWLLDHTVTACQSGELLAFIKANPVGSKLGVAGLVITCLAPLSASDPD